MSTMSAIVYIVLSCIINLAMIMLSLSSARYARQAERSALRAAESHREVEQILRERALREERR